MSDNTTDNKRTYSTGELPAETVSDMELIMQQHHNVSWRESELAPFYKRILAIGILIDLAEVGAIAWWASTGNWRPFAIVLPLVIGAATLVVRSYRRQTAYVCPHCRKVFEPQGGEWFFARHTLTARKLTCTCCGTKDWCAEVSSKRLTT